MRIRSTKPDFWRSETIAELDWDVRLVLKGLESYVDDNGVGKDSVALICADVFPHDLAKDPDTIARVSRALQKLAEANIIVRYRRNGHRFIYVRRWNSIQRVDKPNAGRYPRPDGTMNYADAVDETIGPDDSPGGGATPPNSGVTPEDFAKPRDDFQNPPDTLAPGTEEQRNRGTEGGYVSRERHLTAVPDSEFPPSSTCPDFGKPTHPVRCGACADARRYREQWDIDQAVARATAITACLRCDDEGWRKGLDGLPLDNAVRCDHTPPEAAANA